MAMSSFLQRMIWKEEDDDHPDVAVSGSQCPAEEENKSTTVEDGSKHPSQSVPNDPEVTAAPREPTTRGLSGNKKKLRFDLSSCQSSNSQSWKKPSTCPVEDVVREFEENYNSPTKTPAKKPKNFVKRIVAAFERKHQSNKIDKMFAAKYKNGPSYAHEKSGAVKKSVTDSKNPQQADDRKDEVKNITEETNAKVQEATSSKTMPQIIGAFLKKPVKVEETSIYWIPITDKKLPRKTSFKKLLARLTGKNDAKTSEMKPKQVVFASQENLKEEIQDSGYDGKSISSRTSSPKSYIETLMYHDDEYIDEAYKDCTFSTFGTSSPLKKPGVIQQKPANMFEESRKLCSEKKVTLAVEETDEDVDYASIYSFSEESTPQKNLMANTVPETSYQPAIFPKYSFVPSQPRFYQQNDDDYVQCGETVSLNECRDESIYEVPPPTPQASTSGESVSMRAENQPIQTEPSLEYSDCLVFSKLDNGELSHYATVRPGNFRTYESSDDLSLSISETSEDSIPEPADSQKSSNSIHIEFTSNESFVINVYL